MKEPMLNLDVFKSSVFTFSTIISMIAYAGLISSELILPMYLEDVRGSSAFDTGLTLMPGAIVMGIICLYSCINISRTYNSFLCNKKERNRS